MALESIKYIENNLANAMNIPELLERTLDKVQGIRKSFKDFFKIIVIVFLVLQGRLNFTHMSRWCRMNERRIRRNYRKDFDFSNFNAHLLKDHADIQECFWAIDTSFITKSGMKTYALDKFWNSALQRRAKGLEISLLSLVDANRKKAYNLDVVQTPSVAESLECYKNQLRAQKDKMKSFSDHIVGDGYYATKEFMDFVETELEMYLIVSLRKDADLMYLYEGPKVKRRGAPQKYDGKVDFNDLSKWEKIGKFKGMQVYTKVVYAPHFKRKLRVVILKQKNGEHRVLASTDLNQNAMQIARHYSLRFQIEFNFRDAKQHLGIAHCQSRKKECLHFHFNLVMMIMNLTKILTKDLKGYSLQDIKAEQSGIWWLNFILSNLEIDLSSIKKHPNYAFLHNWGRLRT